MIAKRLQKSLEVSQKYTVKVIRNEKTYSGRLCLIAGNEEVDSVGANEDTVVNASVQIMGTNR